MKTQEELEQMTNWINERQAKLVATMDSKLLLAYIAALLEFQMSQNQVIIEDTKNLAMSAFYINLKLDSGIPVKGHVEVYNTSSEPLTVRNSR